MSKSERKHTPGPWETHPAIAPYEINIFSVKNPWLIAKVDASNVVGEGDAEANAELIARAPELLDQLDHERELGKRLLDKLKWCVDQLEAEAVDVDKLYPLIQEAEANYARD